MPGILCVWKNVKEARDCLRLDQLEKGRDKQSKKQDIIRAGGVVWLHSMRNSMPRGEVGGWASRAGKDNQHRLMHKWDRVKKPSQFTASRSVKIIKRKDIFFSSFPIHPISLPF